MFSRERQAREAAERQAEEYRQQAEEYRQQADDYRQRADSYSQQADDFRDKYIRLLETRKNKSHDKN